MQATESSQLPSPMMSEGRSYCHFLNSNMDSIKNSVKEPEEPKPNTSSGASDTMVPQALMHGIENKSRSRHKRN